MEKPCICDRCGGVMRKSTNTITIDLGNGTISVSGLEHFVCPQDGNVVYPATTIRMLETIRQDHKKNPP